MTIASKIKGLVKSVGGFNRQAGGSMVILTAAMLPAMALMVGGAVDFTNAMRFKQAAQRTIDSTTISLARSGYSARELQTRGETLFTQMMRESGFDVAATGVTFTSGKGPEGASTVSGAASMGSPAYFLGVVGMGAVPVSVASTVTAPRIVPVEISLVLDVSGSMTETLNGSTRLAQLKTAVDGMFTELEADSRLKVSVAVTPYSTSVNLGDLAALQLAPTSVKGAARPAVGDDIWAAERFTASSPLAYALNDDSPTLRAMPFVTAADMGATQPASRMAPLTKNLKKARQTVKDLTASGWTAGHIGMAWGYYALSPKWSALWPKDPEPFGETRKIIVFLSDGDFNTTHNIGSAGNASREDSYAYFHEVCKEAKADAIDIYTVALKLDSASEKELKTCAQGGAGEFYGANSATQLQKAFRDIARKIGRLRVSS